MNIFKKILIFTVAIFSLNMPILLNLNAASSLREVNISSEEMEQLKQLGISEEEINQAMQMFQNMSPEEEKQLEQAVKALEEEMIKEGIDPLNPDLEKMDDFTKSLFDEPAKPAKQTPETIEPKQVTPATPEPTLQDKEKIKQISSILNSIFNNLGILTQKASKDADLNYRLNRYKQELQEFKYYLNVINKKEILNHLIKPDFCKLYNSLIRLNNILKNQVPLIEIDQIQQDIEDLDNPYTQLGISYSATQSEIDEAYQDLKSKWDPATIKVKLENSPNASLRNPKVIKQKLKEATIVFRDIKEAYDRLKNPQERNLVNLELKSQIQREKKAKNISENAFNKIIKSLNESFYSNQLLNKIESLLKQYEPEALEIKKAKEEAEKKALETLKKEQARKAHVVHVRPEKKQDVFRPSYRNQFGGGRYGYDPYDRFGDFGRPYNPSNTAFRDAPSSSGSKSASPKGSGKSDPSTPGDSSKPAPGQPADKADKDKVKYKPKNDAEKEKIQALNGQLSLLEIDLNGLSEIIKDTNILSKLDNIINQPAESINKAVKAEQKNIAELDQLLNQIGNNIQESNKTKNNIKDDKFLLSRLEIIKQSYENFIDNINNEINNIFSPEKVAQYNSLKNVNNQDNLITIKDKINLIHKDFKGLTSIIMPKRGSRIKDDIREFSLILSVIEKLASSLKKDIKDYPFKDLFDYVTNNISDKPILPQPKHLAVIMDSSKLLNSLLKQVKDKVEEIEDNDLLSARWDLIKDQYQKPINEFEEIIQNSIGGKKKAINQEKMNHFKEQQNNIISLKPLIKSSESNSKLIKEISKQITQIQKDKKEASSPQEGSRDQEIDSELNSKLDLEQTPAG